MILSMTGFGRAETQNDEVILAVEIRSVNSRYLDFSPRLPKSLMPFEDEAQRFVKEKCIRGRVSLSAKIEKKTGVKNGMTLNHEKLAEYMAVVKEIQDTSNREDLPSIGDILRLPEIFSGENREDENSLKDLFLGSLQTAIHEMNSIRAEEGKNIAADFASRLKYMDKVTASIQKAADASRSDIVQRYQQKIKDLLDDISIDESRLCQEAAILAEKRDITEEMVRLKSHIELFKSYMETSKNEGKKLNFLIQEMGREINTIGSKTDVIEISHLVVDLKDELEKIREQVQNII